MRLEQSVAELYREFGSYRTGEKVEGCPCCTDQARAEYLARTPLARLTLDDLDKYAMDALLTWGDVNDFKHFLPRLLELAMDHFQAFTMPEVLFGKLTLAEWQTWPPTEFNAVDRFLRAFWLAQLRAPGDEDTLEATGTLLCALGQAYDDLRWCLDSWLEERHSSAARRLAWFCLDNVERAASQQRLANNFWEDRRAQEIQVVWWLQSGEPSGYLRALADELTGTCNGRPLSGALDLLGSLPGGRVH